MTKIKWMDGEGSQISKNVLFILGISTFLKVLAILNETQTIGRNLSYK
jgi:hypothetical protein